MRTSDVRRHTFPALLAAGAIAAVIGIGRLPLLAIIAAAGLVALVRNRRSLGAIGGATAPIGQALTQAWWAPVAALLGALTVAAGIGTVFEAHNLGGRIVGSSLLLLFGACTLWGLLRRPRHRQAGDALVLVGTAPAFPFFWLVVPTVAALAVWVGVLTARPAAALRADPVA